MSVVRAIIALAGVIVPPAVATEVIHYLYAPRLLVELLIFLTFLLLWTEVVRGLKNSD